MSVIDLDVAKQRGRKLTYSLGKTARRSHNAINHADYWADLVRKHFSKPRIHEMNTAEFHHLLESPEGKMKAAHIKDTAGWFGAGHFDKGIRNGESAMPRSMLAQDLDHCDANTLASVTMALQDYAYLLHSTHTHTAENPRYRLIIPASRDMSEFEYRAATYQLMMRIGLSYYDKTSLEFERIMFLPSRPSDGEFVRQVNEGSFVDVDALLDSYGPDDAWKVTGIWQAPGAVFGDARRGKQKKHASESTDEFVRAFDEAFPPHVTVEDSRLLGGEYAACPRMGPNRYTFVGASQQGGLAIYANNSTMFSFGETDPISGKGAVYSFDAVRIHKFGDLDSESDLKQSMTKRSSYQAMIEFCQTFEEFNAAHTALTIGDDFDDYGAVDDFEAMMGSGGSPDPVGKSGKDSDKLRWSLTSAGHKKPSLNNIVKILREDSKLRDAFVCDIRSGTFRLLKPLFGEAWEHVESERYGNAVTDSDVTSIVSYMESRYKIEVPSTRVTDALHLAATKLNLMQDMMESFGKWDGVPRLESIFTDYLGAEDTPMNRETARVTLIGQVSRAFKPGCKFDTTAVIEGSQGVGKSSFVEMLNVERMFYRAVGAIANKDDTATCHEGMVIENPEGTLFFAGSQRLAKAFGTLSQDTYRASYARFNETRQRHFTMIVTTNDYQYLNDETGGRRYLPIRCGYVSEMSPVKLRMRDMAEAMPQIWAEAVHRYQAGELNYTTDAALMLDYAKAQGRAMHFDAIDDEVISYLDKIDSGEVNPNVVDAFDDGEALPVADYFRLKDLCSDVFGPNASSKGTKFSRQVKKSIMKDGRWYEGRTRDPVSNIQIRCYLRGSL